MMKISPKVFLRFKKLETWRFIVFGNLFVGFESRKFRNLCRFWELFFGSIKIAEMILLDLKVKATGN